MSEAHQPSYTRHARQAKPNHAIQAHTFQAHTSYSNVRLLPHYQKFDKALFVTFCKNNREPFAAEARDAILECCLKGNNYRFRLHAAVVMPEHVHMLLTPLRDENGWPYGSKTETARQSLAVTAGHVKVHVNRRKVISTPWAAEPGYPPACANRRSRRRARCPLECRRSPSRCPAQIPWGWR